MRRDHVRIFGYTIGRREIFGVAKLLILSGLVAWFIFLILPILLNVALGAGVAPHSVVVGLVILVVMGGAWGFLRFGDKEPI